MAIGKSVNKKSFYGGMEGGGTPDIAMPPLDETPPIHTAAPDPWENQSQQASNAGMAQVPEELPQETEQEMASDQEEQAEDTPVQAQPKHAKESSVAANMRALRESRDKAERERDELMHMLKTQMQQNNRPQEQHVHEEEPVVDYPDLELDPEALVDGKYVNMLSKQQKQQQQQYRKEMQDLRKELNAYKQTSSEAYVESRIKTQFPDFDKVVSRENVEVLNEMYPELARTLRDTTDTYSKAVSAYKVIKQFGIHKDEVIDTDRMKAIKNSNKPRPLASVNPQQGDSPLSKANAFANGELTADMKEQLRREMYQARKNH